MEYKITIIKQERNPKWKPQRNAYDSYNEEPQYLINETALEVSLKEEEFIAIKKAVIEVIK